MATALTPPDIVLHATKEKANFHRLTELLMCGGITLLREVFDTIHPPTVLPIKLGDPTIQRKLQGLRHRSILTQPEWNQLYPSPGVYGKSKDFDITLLFKLIRTICSLTPPGTGWDSKPNITDLSCEADLVRIKFYRNEVYGHSKTLEIPDPEFVHLWGEISGALVRIAGSISNVKRVEWRKSIEKCLHDPITPDAERVTAELYSWYKNDIVVKDELIKLRDEVAKLNIEQQQKNYKNDDFVKLRNELIEQQEKINVIIHIFSETFKPCTCGSSGSLIPGHFPKFQQPQQAQLPPGSVCVPISSQESQTEGAADGQSTRRQTPSTVLDFWHVVFSFKKSLDVLIEYLRIKLGLDVIDSRLGSLLITVTCSSLEVLEKLWEDYCSGHLSKVVQETLVTPEVLSELDLSEVTLKTIILEDEYKKLKEFLGGIRKRSDELKQQRRIQSQKRVSFKSLDSGCSIESPLDSEDEDEAEGSDETTTKMIEAPRQLRESPVDTPQIQTGNRSSIGFVPLSAGVRDRLTEMLDRPHPTANWRTLARELGLERWSISESAQSSSPTEYLLRTMEARKYPPSKLSEILRKLGRDDAANIIQAPMIWESSV